MPLLTSFSITLSSFASTADQLAAISSETLELVRAVVPARYETQIRDIPALAVQYANDCAWLAERVRVVLEQAASEGVAVDGLARQVDKLVALSTIVLDRQVVSPLAKVSDSADLCRNLKRTPSRISWQTSRGSRRRRTMPNISCVRARLKRSTTSSRRCSAYTRYVRPR
jgi:hypothetical protein